MMRLRRFSTRLLVPGILGTSCFSAVLVWSLIRVHDHAYRVKEESTRHVVELAVQTVGRFAAAETRGQMTREQAQQAALAAIRELRYGSDGYFWINDAQPRMIMHPTNPALDGKDLSGYRDPDGLPLFLKMVEVCRIRGGGTVRYRWPKPGRGEPLAKISYVQIEPHWGWIVGTGIYVDDVESEIGSIVKISIGLLLLTVCICGPLFLSLIRSVTKPVEGLTVDLSRLSKRASEEAGAVLDASRSIARGAADQTRQITDTGESLHSLAATVTAASEEAAATRVLMEQAASAVDTSRQHIQAMSSAMNEISASGREVSAISKTIAEIAFQTNLLALNAAVEAARAGQHGVGFAVVADEVRNLARKASEAADRSAREIAESLRRSAQGAAVVQEMLAGFDRLVEDIRAGAAGASRSAATANAQRDRVSEISSAFHSLDEIARGNESICDETTAAATTMRKEAASMQSLIDPLLRLIRG
jgi:methyl-accepting chemotaxis protein